MLNLLDTVRSQCAGLDEDLLDRHFRSLPATYFERYSPAEIVRHLRLIATMTPEHTVEVEFRPLASHAFEVLVVGFDHPGTVACITAALAAYGFSLEDVQVGTYLDNGEDGDPRYFVISLRVSGQLHRSLAELTRELRNRLAAAFAQLADGKLLEAQTIAADTRTVVPDAGPTPSHRSHRPAPEPTASYEDLILGGDYRLERKLAKGGTSEIYLGTQLSLNRTVAIKLFHHDGTADDDLLARFNQEAMVLAQFSCAQIVQILAAGSAPGRMGGILGWMAMEYMAGGDLARWQRQHGRPPVELATRWFREALEGLHYAHRHSILHRDLKPHNLLLNAEGTLKVSDFGLLKQAQQPEIGLTPHSAILGTPHYMSPEQALGEPLDERSDIFSLGTTFFHLLSGRLPFQKNTAAAVLVQIANEDAPNLTAVAPELPVPLAVFVGRMMARRKEGRYQDAGVILEDLASYERRGLLKIAESGSFIPVQPPTTNASLGIGETQAYQMPPDVT
jgi:hypothetical protein